MNILAFAPMLLEALKREAEQWYPHEVCGILIGRDGQGAEGAWRLVERIERVENRAPIKGRRYEIDPLDILKWQRAAEAEGKAIVGYYHSHPEHPAVPSSTDREKAWPVYSYVIASVIEAHCADVRSWVLADENGDFIEQSIVDMTPIDEQND